MRNVGIVFSNKREETYQRERDGPFLAKRKETYQRDGPFLAKQEGKRIKFDNVFRKIREEEKRYIVSDSERDHSSLIRKIRYVVSYLGKYVSSTNVLARWTIPRQKKRNGIWEQKQRFISYQRDGSFLAMKKSKIEIEIAIYFVFSEMDHSSLRRRVNNTVAL